MPPKSPEQHRNRGKGVSQFINSLPSDERSEHRFTSIPQDDDYGIDGLTQIFRTELHTGIFYLVQIKADKQIVITKRGVIVFALELDKANFYIEIIKEPIVFILCDLKSKKTYWHDIQTNSKTIETFKIAQRENKKYVNIEINPNNTLPETHDAFCKYIQEASTKLNKREESARLSKTSLTSALMEIDQYEEAISLKGYDIYYGNSIPENIKRNVIFSKIDQKNGKQIHYAANSTITPTDYPKIKTKFFFPKTDEGKLKIQEINDVIQGKKDFVEISGEYIKDVEASTGTKIISKSGERQWSMIKLGVPTTESEIFIQTSNSKKEIRLKSKIWLSRDQTFKLDSSGYTDQPLIIKISLNPKDNSSSFNYFLDFTKLDNVVDALFYLKFIEEIKKDGIIHSYINGIKRVLFRFNGSSTKKTEKKEHPHLKILEQLSFIQENTGSKIPYPFPETISIKDIKAISLLYEMLKNGKAKLTIKASFKFDQVLKTADPIICTTAFDKYTIFGEPINLPSKNVKIQGKISKLTKENDLYKVEIIDAEIFFHNI